LQALASAKAWECGKQKRFGGNLRMDTGKSVDRYHLILFQTGFDSIRRGLVFQIHRLLNKHISTLPENTEIDLWIESPGGDAHAAYKLSLDLRHRCSKLRAIVPDYAKSAATLLLLGVDEIFMSQFAELGPLDAQIEHPEKERAIVSALDVADSLNSLGKESLTLAYNYTDFFMEVMDLPRLEALRCVLDFMAQFVQPIVSKLDPHRIHQATNILDVATEYGMRLLSTRNVAPEFRLNEQSAERLVENLVKDYKSHEFIISRGEAERLGFPVFAAESHPRWRKMLQVYEDFEDCPRSVVKILKDSDLDSSEVEEEKGAENPSLSGKD